MTTKLALALAIALLAVVFYLQRAHRSAASQFSIEDLLLGDDGRASKAAFVMFVALAISSWVIILQAMSGTLTDLTFGAYLAAWVAPTVTKMITATPSAGDINIKAETVQEVKGGPST